MKTLTRALRRYAVERAKAKARRKLERGWMADEPPTPRQVGKAAAMHNTCPCGMCTTRDPRPTRQRELFMSLLMEAV